MVMADFFHRARHFFVEWMRTSVREVVLKAPRERPDMLVWVFLAAAAVIVVYVVTAIQHV
jgi:hypothetical protein